MTDDDMTPTDDDRKQFVQEMYEQALAKGHKPPFTLTLASAAGTVHTIRVTRDGHATHSIQHLKPDQLFV
jgi:VCBS repeat-containing protein